MADIYDPLAQPRTANDVLNALAQGVDPMQTQPQTKTGMLEGMTEEQLGQAGMLAGGATGLIGGVADIIMGQQMKKDAQAAQTQYQGTLDDLAASQPSLSTPAEYYEMAKNAYDTRLMQMRTEDINRGLANTTAAASQFGSRGLGALAGATQSANRAQREETLMQQQMQTQALGQLAGARENEIGRREMRSQNDIAYNRQQLDQAVAMEQMAKQQQMAGIASTVGGVASLAVGGLPGMIMDEGGKVQKTPGKFSHAENEMAVITEDGDDTGIRVTGGEYVLNPEQSQTIKKLVEAGDKNGLMSFMDNLLDEPQFS